MFGNAARNDVKIVLDSTDDLRSLSVLLGDAGAAREAEKR